MKDKMYRFLKSIGIENPELFDLDFDMVCRDRFNHQQINMAIVKTDPWNYTKLTQFQEGLNKITYPYSISFSYKNRPNGYDVMRLFEDWYQTLYRVPHNLDIEVNNDSLLIKYISEEEQIQYKSQINDFRDFLDFLYYEIVILEKVILQEEKASEQIIKQVTKEAEASVEIIESKQIEIDDKSSVEEIYDIEEEHKNEQKLVEKEKIKELEKNLKEMEKARKAALMNKRGDYNPLLSIKEIKIDSGNVDFEGFVYAIDSFQTRKGSTIYNYCIGDDDSAVMVRAISGGLNLKEEKLSSIIKGSHVRIRGAAGENNFANGELFINVHYLDLLPPKPPRIDKEEEKRVELHLHTKMSTMDGVSTISDYVRVAKEMGHKAIAITDHGVTQGFPEAQNAAKKAGIKMIYGSELYMIDDKPKYVFNPKDIILSKATYVVFDLETTGLSARYSRVVEFGAVRFENGMVTKSLDILINPQCKMPPKVSQKNNITDDMLIDQPLFKDVKDQILDFIGDAILVSHNAEFDVGFLNAELGRINEKPVSNPVIDTLPLSRFAFPKSRGHSLGDLCRNLEIIYDEEKAHRADYDAKVLNDVWQALLASLTKENAGLRHKDLLDLEISHDYLKHFRSNHIVALAKNKAGLKDLYKLISISHLDYFADYPKIPRRIITEYRKNLLIGSGCFNGEVFDTARVRTREELIKKISFYDYIELQPKENYSWLINMGYIDDEQELEKYMFDIIDAAKEAGVIVVATGDAHYVNKEDKIYRDVYILAKAVGNVSHPLFPYSRERMSVKFPNPDQHFRSTDEMLSSFKFLGSEKAKEIVVTNSNIIANMIEEIEPISDKLYTPVIENSEEMLKELCYKNLHEKYGENPPEIVKERLDKELHGIISNGYSVIYYIAHRIIKKAAEDGFMVGSRGSVGSSFAATMADITEVNPLPPHYRCPKCKHVEFSNDNDIRSGFDLVAKNCPICGSKMIGDGQNIPFETFLGFNADKVPDIDLNFPGDYQSRAHDFTKVLLGENNVFRAGTIETVADKTAFGYAKGYYERMGLESPTRAMLTKLSQGCMDVKRTTGQHPGGIVVIPTAYEVYDFTPVQWPADDMESNWKTTHFEFKALHDTVLKLDLLGHVDPMALKMMADLTHVDVVNDIPMNDPKVLSLFTTDAALNRIEGHNYLQVTNGALAIPEFGTPFVRGLINETKPKTFADLVIISGLSHGTNVWQNNAQELIENGTCDLRGVIGCRDDIMSYLVSKGVPNKIAFAIMEDVRKGKKVKKEFEEVMLANGVPRYYIDSCNKIKYMFPKAHATAYVMMAIRVGFFKVYYPLEFYATFFSVRSKQYEINTMIKGERAIIDRLEELKKKRLSKEKMTPKEEEIEKTLRIAIEMVERGYKFANVDLYKSEATSFVCDHENKQLIPPFVVLDNLGESAASSVIEARKNGEFLSKEDLSKRTKLSSTNIEDLSNLGALKGLNDTNQLSIFDFM